MRLWFSILVLFVFCKLLGFWGIMVLLFVGFSLLRWWFAQVLQFSRTTTFYTQFFEAADPKTREHTHRAEERPPFQRHSGTSLQEAYGTLGIRETATPAEIKKAYRRLMSQYHPDKLAARGTPENKQKSAAIKAQQISVAYERIRKDRGFR